MGNKQTSEEQNGLTPGIMEIAYSIRDRALQSAQQSGDFERAQRINELLGEISIKYQEPVFLRRQMD